jgi:hypothetical protein
LRTPAAFIALVFAAAVTLASAPALASANVDCQIDDKFITFDMEAIAGRNGPIVQVNVGRIAIKPAAAKLAAPALTFDRTHIVQQWTLDDDLRLQIEVADDKTNEGVNLVLVARLDKKTEKYAGRYVLTITRGGKTVDFKGRIKECQAG